MPENPNSLEERPVDLREVLRVLWRRRWLFVIPCVVTVVGGVAGAFLLPSVYESSVVLMMEGPQQLPANLRGMVGRSNTD
ncbi:MAG: Wzz/FepE/Etk N-terminal domain-containing protein, partial [Candidatus Eisenbacteria bacterium]